MENSQFVETDQLIVDWDEWKKKGLELIERCYLRLVEGSKFPETLRGVIKDVASIFGPAQSQGILDRVAFKVLQEKSITVGSKWVKFQDSQSSFRFPVGVVIEVCALRTFNIIFRRADHTGNPGYNATVEEFLSQFKLHGPAGIASQEPDRVDQKPNSVPGTPLSLVVDNTWINSAVSSGLSVGSRWVKFQNKRGGRSYKIGTEVTITHLRTTTPDKLRTLGKWIVFRRADTLSTNRCCEDLTWFLEQYRPASDDV